MGQKWTLPKQAWPASFGKFIIHRSFTPSGHLERLTKPLDVPPTDQRAGKRQERLMHVCSPLMSNAQSTEPM
jgi:hypothetical protein